MTDLEHLSALPAHIYKKLTAKGIETVEALVETFPRRYKDVSDITPFKDLYDGDEALVKGVVTHVHIGNCVTLTIADDLGDTMCITWFQSGYASKLYFVGDTIYCYGKIGIFRNTWSMPNPEFHSKDPSRVLGLHPVHPKYAGLSDASMKLGIGIAINYLVGNQHDTIKTARANELGLVSLGEALNGIHFPESKESVVAGRERLAFEKFWVFYNDLKNAKKTNLAENLRGARKETETNLFIEDRLPFDLTEGQLSAVASLKKIMFADRRINAIVTGDVGCGKTAVAMIASILMAENGLQTAVLAPTLVLATQHFAEFNKMLEGLEINGKPVKAGLVTGKSTAKHKREVAEGIKSGEITILIGTHAVLSDGFEFSNLGLLIVDEEHKFGVAQKNKLNKRSHSGVHYMAMTATPIPRSIALTLYDDDTAIIPIETMPNGRKPIITTHSSRSSEAFEKIVLEVNKGHQAYIVCPLISESDSVVMSGVTSIEEAEQDFKSFLKDIPAKARPVFKTITGKMKSADIEKVLADFADGKIDVLLSTTIVEVGVNVPNATAICIMSAGRFGLAGLHQLRGRVGRNSSQGYCLLVDSRQSERLDVICGSTNGFQIAEEDLRLRGPGDITGDAQKGQSEIINEITKRPNLAAAVKSVVLEKIY